MPLVDDEPAPARVLWRAIEPVHAVVYFAPEVTEAVTAAGVAGWWRGYVAGRAAPLGPVPAPVVEALFHGFAPQRIAKALPSVWDDVEPARLLEVRDRAVLDALHRIAPDACADTTSTGRAVELLRRAVDGAEVGGRALYAAHRARPWPMSPVAQLWHACTLLREHRGDGHVAALTAAGLDGAAANLLAVAAGVVPDGDAQRLNRGWSGEEWDAAAASPVAAGLLADDGSLTGAGAALRHRVEHSTDVAAGGPPGALGPSALAELVGLLEPWVDAVVASGTVGFPNAMGLTRRRPGSGPR